MDRLALLARAAELSSSRQVEEAEAIYRQLLDDEPQDAAVLSNLGAVLNMTARYEEAEQVCRAALDAQPGYWAALGNLGNALHRMQRHDEAIAAYVAAVRANNNYPNACSNLGVALNEQWRMRESLIMHDQAVALAPDHALVRANRGMARLIAGDLKEGFAEFEWRWKMPGTLQHGLEAPQWTGSDPKGVRIFLHDEGGYGDTLQFLRYAPMLAALGATVILQVQKPLLRLARLSFPQIETIIARGDPVPPHDMHCSMISLPHAFGTSLETVPGQTPYLLPEPAAAQAWRQRLDAHSGRKLRVGLVWAGAPRPGMPSVHMMDRRRSIALAQLAPLAAVAGIEFISLQQGREAEVAAPPAGMALVDAMAEMGDFADTAALAVNLDLVIAVDTAVAHLAAGLGRPVWVLSRFDACWRWIAGRSDCPWYPGMRLYRQSQPGAWEALIAQVAADLQVWAGQGHDLDSSSNTANA